jgi:dethiobiotin synthetase
MVRHIIFVTGTDTGVGKTVFAALLTRCLCEQGVPVAGLKPICSGGRKDALRLRDAMGKGLTLESVNPWHFRAALSPLLAARMVGKRVELDLVVAHVRAIQKQFTTVVVEGAGGLLSPLGEGFDSRDLVTALRAKPVVVCPNRLGAVNQLLLTLEALPQTVANQAQIVLMNPPRMDAAARTNPKQLAEFVRDERIHALDWLGTNPFAPAVEKRPAIKRMLERFVQEIKL